VRRKNTEWPMETSRTVWDVPVLKTTASIHKNWDGKKGRYHPFVGGSGIHRGTVSRKRAYTLILECLERIRLERIKKLKAELADLERAGQVDSRYLLYETHYR
jgi:hypothetical protein